MLARNSLRALLPKYFNFHPICFPIRGYVKFQKEPRPLSDQMLNPPRSSTKFEYQKELVHQLYSYLNLDSITLPPTVITVDEIIENMVIETTTRKTEIKNIINTAPKDIRTYIENGSYLEALQILQHKYVVERPSVLSLFVYCLGQLNAISVFVPFFQQASSKLETLDPKLLSEAFTVAMRFLNHKIHSNIILMLMTIMIQNRVPVTDFSFLLYLKTFTSTEDIEKLVFSGKPRMNFRLLAEVVAQAINLSYTNVDKAAELYKFSRSRSLVLASRYYDRLFPLFLRHEKYLDLATEIGFSKLQKIYKVGVTGDFGFVEEMTINLILQACASFGDWKLAELVWLKMVQSQIIPDAQAYYAVIEAYAKGKQFLAAFRTINLLFSTLPKAPLDYKSFQIVAIVAGKNREDALACTTALKTLHMNGEVIHHCAAALTIEALCIVGEQKLVLEVLDSLETWGVRINQYILSAIGYIMNEELIEKLLQICQKSDVSANVYYKLLCDSLAKQDSKSCLATLDILNRLDKSVLPIEYLEQVITNLKSATLPADKRAQIKNVISTILISKYNFSEKYAYELLR